MKDKKRELLVPVLIRVRREMWDEIGKRAKDADRSKADQARVMLARYMAENP